MGSKNKKIRQFEEAIVNFLLGLQFYEDLETPY